MVYYDANSPQILVNNQIETTIKSPIQFPFGSFPSAIKSKPLVDALLHFWSASLQGDAIRRYLYNYQIIEYAAYFFVEDNTKKAIRKYLASPTALGNIDEFIERIIGLLGERNKSDEIQRFEALIRNIVRLDPQPLWREITNNLARFTSAINFDGGLELEALTKVGSTPEEFAKSGIDEFTRNLRKIRNGLSHGKEQYMSGVITPTTRNLDLVRSWIGPISVLARQVMVFREVA
jgi:hypothetical protein